MKETGNISAGQLAIFLFMFSIGSTPMFQLGIKAGQDSWIALCLAAVAGFGMLWVYRTLQNRAPEEDIAGLYKLHFGKIAGTVLGLGLSILLAYESMRNVRDFGELTSSTLLPQTPMWCVMLLITAIAYYTVSKGVFTFFRITQILFPMLLGSYTLMMFLLLVSGLIDYKQLRPVLENGYEPVLKTAFPDLLSFPFSQVVVLLVYWKYTAGNNKAGVATYSSYIAVSIFLVAVNAVIMMVLGPAVASIKAFPTLEAVELIRLFNFIERLDILVTLLLYIGLYIKIAGMYFSAVLLLRSACGVPVQVAALIYGPIIYAMSFMEPTNTFHLWAGLEVSVKFTPIYHIAIPLIMLLIGFKWVKRKAERQKPSGPQAPTQPQASTQTQFQPQTQPQSQSQSQPQSQAQPQPQS
ncbi:endospore germination permease [Paenibacillus pasadenensis]|uniref:GerAB/ArcD/ProY family transporter n=1 Tax=Paenibacillus pasadenensis TaxID=217090 RepID=UPI00203CD108|nr:endospore germination permease [Paenibacillus pasadenensis]MCM3746082.1 endospore germination permease [Paenibacillus pasadenensis]